MAERFGSIRVGNSASTVLPCGREPLTPMQLSHLVHLATRTNRPYWAIAQTFDRVDSTCVSAILGGCREDCDRECRPASLA